MTDWREEPRSPGMVLVLYRLHRKGAGLNVGRRRDVSIGAGLQFNVAR